MFRIILSALLLALVAFGLFASRPTAHAAGTHPKHNTLGHSITHNAPNDHLVHLTKTTSSNADSFVTCPAGYLILSGGFKGNKDLNVYMNTRSGNGWKVKAKAFNGASSTRTVYALCISDDFEVAYSTHATTVPVNTRAGSDAICPEDYEIVAGGYSFASSSLNTYDTAYVTDSFNIGAAWRANLQNSSNIGRKLKTTAICILTLELNPDYRQKTLSVPAHTTKNSTFKCNMPEFFEMIGGGFLTESSRIVASYPMDAATKWRTTFYNPTGTASGVAPKATCAELAAL